MDSVCFVSPGLTNGFKALLKKWQMAVNGSSVGRIESTLGPLQNLAPMFIDLERWRLWEKLRS